MGIPTGEGQRREDVKRYYKAAFHITAGYESLIIVILLKQENSIYIYIIGLESNAYYINANDR